MLLKSTGDQVPQGIRESREAFSRDLPELMKDQALRGQWVAYRGDERIDERSLWAGARDLALLVSPDVRLS